MSCGCINADRMCVSEVLACTHPVCHHKDFSLCVCSLQPVRCTASEPNLALLALQAILMQPGEPSDKNQEGFVLKCDLGWQWSPAEDDCSGKQEVFVLHSNGEWFWKQRVQKGGILPETEVAIKQQAGCKLVLS